MFEPAERLKSVKVSASAAMTRKVRELRAQGVKIVGLSSGEPDFRSPAHAIEAAHQAALAGETKYPPQDGVLPLKKAVQKKFKRDNNLDYALDEIMVSNGSKQIMYNATMASVNPGRRGDHPLARLDQLRRPGEARGRRAGRRVVPGEQPLPPARRRPRRRDHVQDQMGGAELPQQSDRRGVHARRDARDRRRAAEAPARAHHVGRDLRAPAL